MESDKLPDSNAAFLQHDEALLKKRSLNTKILIAAAVVLAVFAVIVFNRVQDQNEREKAKEESYAQYEREVEQRRAKEKANEPTPPPTPRPTEDMNDEQQIKTIIEDYEKSFTYIDDIKDLEQQRQYLANYLTDGLIESELKNHNEWKNENVKWEGLSSIFSWRSIRPTTYRVWEVSVCLKNDYWYTENGKRFPPPSGFTAKIYNVVQVEFRNNPNLTSWRINGYEEGAFSCS